MKFLLIFPSKIAFLNVYKKSETWTSVAIGTQEIIIVSLNISRLNKLPANVLTCPNQFDYVVSVKKKRTIWIRK